jgi:hypothetical protein
MRTRFTCFTRSKVRILGTLADASPLNSTSSSRCSIYLLYWYQSTHTDAEGAAADTSPLARRELLLLLLLSMLRLQFITDRFTCFTSTKVPKYKYSAPVRRECVRKCVSCLCSSDARFTCFTGTKVQILTQKGRQVLLLSTLIGRFEETVVQVVARVC